MINSFHFTAVATRSSRSHALNPQQTPTPTTLRITIPGGSRSNQGSDFATLLWECSILLSWYLTSTDSSFGGDNDDDCETTTTKWNEQTTLEIGAGVALPSLVASALGAQTIISDRIGSFKDDIFENVKRTIALNQQSGQLLNIVQPTFIELSYGLFNQTLLDLPPLDYLFASDLFYNNTRGMF
eukprot:gene5958-6901_t